MKRVLIPTLAIAAMQYMIYIQTLHYEGTYMFPVAIVFSAICGIIYYRTIYKEKILYHIVLNFILNGIILFIFECVHTPFLYSINPPDAGHYTPAIYILLMPAFIFPLILLGISAAVNKFIINRRK